jgi:hypothetical protein
MSAFRVVLVLAGVGLGACGSESREPKLPASVTVFPNLPLPPSAQFVSRSGSEETLQIRLHSANKADDVIRYYRRVFSGNEWRLVGDTKSRDGSVTLYAEQNGPPIWVRIWPTSDGVGTMVELSGAVVSTAADTTGLAKKGPQASPRPVQ